MRQPVRKVGEVKDYFNLLMSCCMQKSAIAIKSILHLHVGHMSTEISLLHLQASSSLGFCIASAEQEAT